MQINKVIRPLCLVFLVILNYQFLSLFDIRKEFDKLSYASILYSKEGTPIASKVSDEGSWRFRLDEDLPKDYIDLLILFEDKRFYYHCGFDILAFIRAFGQDLKARSVVSGGSTITMQTARLSFREDRTIKQKIKEVFYAYALERLTTKREVLELYAENAPFGYNIVGLPSASLKYFDRHYTNLSVAEYAFLVVLPNNPSMIKTPVELKAKRDRLLKRYYKKGKITESELEIALASPVPTSIIPTKNIAPHLMYDLDSRYDNSVYYTTIDYDLQQSSLNLGMNYLYELRKNGIENLAILIIENQTNEVITYIGNVAYHFDDGKWRYVDMIRANRSTGSTLKPLLYALSLDSNLILPSMLYPDIPTKMGDFVPKNFDKKYRGAFPLDDSLVASLNVPFAYLLRDYGIKPFMVELKRMGFDVNMNRDYGIPLILGGYETTLFDLAHAYSFMARKLSYNEKFSTKPKTLKNEVLKEKFEMKIGAESIYLTFNTLTNVNRQDSINWQNFEGGRKVAWKSGTSFGNKDAILVGVDPKYTVALWAGNASGEGKPEILGAKLLSELFFQIWSNLESVKWFEKPDGVINTEVCYESGYIKNENCTKTKIIETTKDAYKTPSSPYDKKLKLSSDGSWQVNSSCYDVFEMTTEEFMVLEPTMTSYYKKIEPNYKEPPPFLEGCKVSESGFNIDYPQNGDVIYTSKDGNNEISPVVFKAYSKEESTLFWHIDQNYIKSSTGIEHKLDFVLENGEHVLTVVDTNGNSKSVEFESIE